MISVSTRSLRIGLVLSAVLLVAVVASFIGYAHYRTNRFLAGLPGKLGMKITQETDNFTYSQSLKGKTVFTVHASKEIQRSDGRITLKDVGIVLFGRKADRADRIHGNEFEYDQKKGTMRAIGDAFIDLSEPAAKSGAKQGNLDSQMIHVKTNGLVFLQKERTASTDGMIEFAAGGLSGNALGASYDSNLGVLVLRSAVQLSGLRGGAGREHSVVLTAARAEMDRDENVVQLEGPRYVSAGLPGAQTLTAERARVYLNPQGDPERVEAQGHVVLDADRRGRIAADRLEAELMTSGLLRNGHLSGGVRMIEDVAARHRQGQGEDLFMSFDAMGRPATARIAGGVKFREIIGTSNRELTAEKVELAFTRGGGHSSILRSAIASGPDGAHLQLTNAKPTAHGTTAVGVRADLLKARFEGSVLTGLDGMGNTLVERVNLDPGGIVESKETSTGKVLLMDLKSDGKGRTELARATQRGAVQAQREVAAKAGGVPGLEHSRADEAVYEADADLLTLTGAVQISDAESALLAEHVELRRGDDDATAEGNVRVTYEEPAKPGAREPVHVMAAQALTRKATGVTVFTAAAGERVRMWEAGSQLEAPVLEVSRAGKSLFAHGVGDGVDVRAILAGAADDSKTKQEGSESVRIVSQQMRYSDATRQAEFSGHVRMDRDGTMRAPKVTVFLVKPAEPDAGVRAARAVTMPGGQVEHVVAEGGVEITQPGRNASGERLVYSAADRTFVLTGTRTTPPRLTDEARGTITGASLRFRSGDDSVVISGSDTGSGPGRTRSATRVRQ